MYELYPYFTNDGTVGLFSQQDNDIYHSTYGALTESWQKFILPSHLKEHLASNDSVKILDICYGIGYNTKTALNVFIDSAIKKEKLLKKNSKIKFNFNKKFHETKNNIGAIHTDNISGENNNSEFKIFEKILELSHVTSDYNYAIDADNIDGIKLRPMLKPLDVVLNLFQHRKNIRLCGPETSSGRRNSKNKACALIPKIGESPTEKRFLKEILIDAVDVDKTLIELSPFIQINSKNNVLITPDNYYQTPNSNQKFNQIKKIHKSWTTNLNREFKLKNEVSIIILDKLLKQFDINNDKILQVILNENKYLPFLSSYMVNFAKFYQNISYNKNQKLNKPSFLHNIYYRYITKSYKNVLKLFKTCKIDLNFYPEDARNFVKSSNNTYDYIFIDAFTPAKCPSLWTFEFFNHLYSKLNNNGMILTYSNSAAIRNAFLKNGFCVGKVYDKDIKKFTGTIATKNINLIEYPLSDLDLDLINSKAGICFRDATLDASNETIISNRLSDVNQSDLASSSRVIKGYKHDQI